MIDKIIEWAKTASVSDLQDAVSELSQELSRRSGPNPFRKSVEVKRDARSIVEALSSSGILGG